MVAVVGLPQAELYSTRSHHMLFLSAYTAHKSGSAVVSSELT
jgi:hypothetical protein